MFHFWMLRALRQFGIVELGNVLWLPEYLSKTKDMPWHPGHVVAKGDGSVGLYCRSMDAILSAPGPLAEALRWTDLVEEYFGVEPVLYSVNQFVTKAGEAVFRPGLNGFHRDFDDRQQLALFIYGSDVMRPEFGAQVYKLGSHRPSHLDLDFASHTVLGRQGKVWMTDPSGLHMGGLPDFGERMLFWCRWGVSDPPAIYRKDRLKPVDKKLVADYPRDPRLQRIVRLIVR